MRTNEKIEIGIVIAGFIAMLILFAFAVANIFTLVQ
jgi:hypothetical protein